MLRVVETLDLSIPLEGLDVEKLEGAIAQQVRELAKRVMEKALAQVEEKVLERGNFIRKKKVQRHLCTVFGWVRFLRYKVQEKGGGHHFPLDRALGLAPGQRATQGVVKLATELATRHPYREAARLLALVLGDEVNHRTIHHWVQKVGERVVEKEEEGREATFGCGEVPRRDGKVREIVVVEVDGTTVSSQEEGEEQFEMKLGVMYSGKELESKKAKHKRYRLKEKVLYGGVEGAEEFGEKLFLAGEERLSLSLARHILGIGDGATWIPDLVGGEVFKGVYQLDWWHLERRIREALPRQPALAGEIMGHIRRGEAEKARSLLRLRGVLVKGEEEKVTALLGYLEDNWHGIYGSRSLKEQVVAQEVLVVGSGAMEKNIDVVVGRRFKGRGMSWSRRGAHHLLKLRLMVLEGRAWRRWWKAA